MISIGIVQSEIDFTESGQIKVLIDGVGEEDVEYTSPVKGTSAGFVAIPKSGSKVLVCKSTNGPGWFYLSTLSGPSRLFRKGDIDKIDTVLGGDMMPYWSMENPYLRTITPQVMGMVSTLGAGLVLSDSATESVRRIYTALKSATDHVVVMSDDGESEGIVIKTNQGDPGVEENPETKIALMGKTTKDPLEANSINIQAKRNVWTESRFGNMISRIYKGGRMLLQNKSRADSSQVERLQDGEIEIETFHNDIHICVRHPKRNVIIESWGEDGFIQLYTEGAVQVHAGGNINLDSKGEINIKATGNINIDSGENIYLNSNTADTGTRQKSHQENERGSLEITD